MGGPGRGEGLLVQLLSAFSPAQTLQNIYKVLRWAFTVFPPFCLGQGLIELCYNQVRFDLAHSFGVDAYASPFETGFLGWTFVQLASQGTVLLLLRLSLHWDLVRRPRCVSGARPLGHQLLNEGGETPSWRLVWAPVGGSWKQEGREETICC